MKFNKLKPGASYKLPEKRRIPNQRTHVQNACLLSSAVYEDDSDILDYLRDSSSKHSIYSVIAVSKNSPQKVLLAVGNVASQKVLYVAYRGSVTKEDWLADIDVQGTQRPNMDGLFHSGFSKRSVTVPVSYILECSDHFECSTIITCGHSLGGAVSTISALDLMMELKDSTTTRAYNITFGAPFFANNDVLSMAKEGYMDKNILNYTSYKDVIPGILNLEHTAKILKEANIDYPGETPLEPWPS